MEKQRRFPRLNMAIQMEYAVLDANCNSCKAKIEDISVAGISVKTKELLKKGTYLDVKFYLPKDKTPVEAISKVAWSREIGPNNFETGIEFIKINYADQERIGNLITEE
ncbi:MAG: PilZ domain-containing protein [Candidatus Omnitrophica bacterium]|nr:PilZ domain-containing protein [Candidatus Omnitrophota bacterium]MDD5236111.1 PilZ domain-containing protein [Candidatus Omnitrophota bacterium]MDD5610456.1 PilZ domain-containing protein [Candidatus Omnitrophota bacterium]